MSLTGILAIQNGRNAGCETHVENLLGIRDTCRDAGDDLRISQFLEGFVFGHALILAYLRAEVY